MCIIQIFMQQFAYVCKCLYKYHCVNIRTQTTYQRDYEIWKANKGEVSSKPTDDRTSQRDDKTQSSHRSDVMGPQSLESGSMRSFKSGQSALSGSTAGGVKTSGGSPLTARALAHLEAVEEERERKDYGGLVFGSPRGKAAREEPTTNPQTGKSVRPKHEHLYSPLQEQLKRLMPDFTPVTSAPASDRSHYVDAKTRAAEYAEARANASKSESGSVTARAWCGQKNAQRKDVRVRLVTTKMMRARPIGSEAKTGEECLNDIDDARRQRAAPTLPERFGKGAAKTPAIVPFSTEAAAAAAKKGAAAAAAWEVRSEKLKVRRLGQRDFSSVLKAGWEGEEHVDRHQKSRSPSQGGANYDTQMILSPGLLKSRLDVAHERQRRREVRAHTPRVSPCAKAFTSIQTMSMQGYDYRVVNGMVPKDGAIWRYTPPPKPYTPPTPLRLVTSPRSSKSNVTTPRNPASIHNIPRIKVCS